MIFLCLKVILPQLIAIITFVVVAVNVASIVPLGAADAHPSSTRQESSIKAVDGGQVAFAHVEYKP
jgi:hypothetical protein